MRSLRVNLMMGSALGLLAGCATTPADYHVTPDGTKEFVVAMERASFSPSYLSVNQGDRVRLVIYSYYQFAFFYFPQLNLNREVPHDAPETVELVATERGWFDFYGYGFYPYYANPRLAGGDTGGEERLFESLYVR